MTEKKFDANEVAFLELELEAMRQQELEIEYPLNKALQFIPMRAEPAGAESFAYAELDFRGAAKWLAKGADDVNLADIELAKHTSPLHRFGHGYEYSFDDLKAAQMAGRPIDAKRRDACRKVMENMMDDIASGKDADMADLGLKGLANHPNVTVVTAAANGDASATPWNSAGKTGLEVLADMNELVRKMNVDTKGLHSVNTILLPLARYHLIRLTPLDANGYSANSILSAFQMQNPGVTVDTWHLLDTMDAAGTGPRAIAYEKSPNNLEFVVADPLAEDAPERKGRKYIVRMTAKVGGTVVYRPKALLYMDGI
jgi:hypothetical protein